MGSHGHFLSAQKLVAHSPAPNFSYIFQGWGVVVFLYMMCVSIEMFHILVKPQMSLWLSVGFYVVVYNLTVLIYWYIKHHVLSVGKYIKRERNVLFNDALNTFYLGLYGVRHMVKDHSDSERWNLMPPHRLLLSINSKGSFICTIPQTG